MPVILVASQDESLLHTRALVLRATGSKIFTASAASLLDISREVSKDHPIDVVVLCHSIPEPTRVALVEALVQYEPAPSFLLVSRERFFGVREVAGHLGVVSPSDPPVLLAAANRLLASRAARGVEPGGKDT